MQTKPLGISHPCVLFFFCIWRSWSKLLKKWMNTYDIVNRNISTIFWSGWTFRTPPKNRPGHQLLEALSHWWTWHFGNDGWFLLWMDKILLLVTIWNTFLMGLYCDACHLTTGAGVLPSTVFLLFVVSFQWSSATSGWTWIVRLLCPFKNYFFLDGIDLYVCVCICGVRPGKPGFAYI